MAPASIHVLGPIEVEVAGNASPIAGAVQQRILAALCLEPGSMVPTDRLVETAWPVNPPTEPRRVFRTYMSRLRRSLNEAGATNTIVTLDGGYALAPDVDVDAVLLASLIDDARHATGAEVAAERYAEALDLWRGDPFGPLGSDPAVQPEAVRLDELRASAAEGMLAAWLCAGRAAEVVEEIGVWMDRHPFSEALCALKMRALAATGRQTEALRTFRTFRAQLADQAGLEPSTDLAMLEHEILTDVGAESQVVATNNLPPSVDAFVGRRGELSDVAAALSESRLVTLTGVGGTGKTRLALEAAAQLLGDFRDGIWLVELAPVSDAAAVPVHIGTAVGVLQQPGKSMLDSLMSSLATRDLLLILDNCEHLIDEAADFVSALEARCTGVKVLVTSREGLGVRGEHLLAVRSLPTGDAVELFVSRARAVGTEVAINDDSVRRIVERLDGLPLAIELAAARTRGLSTQEIEHRLTERFRLLRGGRGRVERQQTLWNTVAWSHQLLEPLERIVFDRLSTFTGGFTLDAAIGVCAGDGVDDLDVEHAVLSLVDRSMVVADIDGPGTRYRLLETLRQFGEAQLLDAGQTDLMRRRHAAWYAQFAQQAGAASKGRDGVAWSRLLRAELDNFREVIFSDDVKSARCILASLEAWPLFWERFEYIDWALAVIEPPAPDDPDWLGTALWAAYGCTFAGRLEDILTLLAPIDPDAVPPGMLRYLWELFGVFDAWVAGREVVPLLRPLLDIATDLDNDFDRLWGSSYVSYVSIAAAGEIDLAAEIWGTLTDDPARSTVPTVAPMLAYYEGAFLASIHDPAEFGCLEAGRRASIDCGNTIFEHAAICGQIPLHVERGSLSTASRQVTTMISQQIRTGSYKMLWIALPGLIRLLDQTGQRDQAREIWAEAGERLIAMIPARRAEIEARLGPPGQPRLSDDQLVTMLEDVLRELERVELGRRRAG